jgi:hypothetical protein
MSGKQREVDQNQKESDSGGQQELDQQLKFLKSKSATILQNKRVVKRDYFHIKAKLNVILWNLCHIQSLD